MYTMYWYEQELKDFQPEGRDDIKKGSRFGGRGAKKIDNRGAKEIGFSAIYVLSNYEIEITFFLIYINVIYFKTKTRSLIS